MLFCIVFITLGLPFTGWWFYGADDSHALFLAYKTKTWVHLFSFFYDGHVNQGQIGPSNFIASTERTSFFSTYYRPLCLIFYALYHWTFGINGYAFHLINVGIHALNTSLVFLILRWFTTPAWAFLSSLLFAFHPQIAFRFGAFVNLQYYLSLTGVLAITLLFKKYLDTNKIIYLLLACLIYAPLLFLRESTIILPIIMFIAEYLYKRSQATAHPEEHSVSKGPFFTLMISFLLTRLWLYPLNITSNHPFSITNFITSKIPEFQLFIYDLFNLSWLPWGQPILRISILLLISSTLLFLFWHNTKKLYLCASAFIVACMLWPACFGPYSPRYFYEVQPFVLITFILLFSWQKKPWQTWQKKIGFTMLSLIVITHMIFCIINFQRRVKKMAILHNAIEEVVSNDFIKTSKRPLCFIGHPFDGFACQNAQIFWIMLNDTTRKIYFDSATSLISPHANVITSTRWGTITSNYPTEDFYTITQISDGFKFKSHDPNEIHFCLINHGYSLGKKEHLKEEKPQIENTVVTEFSLHLEQRYRDENPIFLSWSFEKKAFVIILIV